MSDKTREVVLNIFIALSVLTAFVLCTEGSALLWLGQVTGYVAGIIYGAYFIKEPSNE